MLFFVTGAPTLEAHVSGKNNTLATASFYCEHHMRLGYFRVYTQTCNLLCVLSTEQLLLFQVRKMSLYFSHQWIQCHQQHYCHLSGFSILPLALLITRPGAALSSLEPCFHSPSDTDNITCVKKNVLREGKKSNLRLSTQPGQSTHSMTALPHL